MTLKVITTDLINLETGILCHLDQTGVMGTRINSRLYHRFPELSRLYRQQSFILGVVHTCWIDETLCIANLSALNLESLDYPSLVQCLKWLYQHSQYHHLTPYLPFGLGCGLWKGNWQKICYLIAKYCPNAVICKIPKFTG